MAGTKKTKSQLYTDRSATIYSNGVNAINGADHAIFIEDVIASCINELSDYTKLGLFPYETTRTYYLGQAVTYNDGGGYGIFICSVATTTGIWASGDWTKVELTKEIRKGITNITTDPQTIPFTLNMPSSAYVFSFRVYDSVSGATDGGSSVITKGVSGFTISSPLIGANVYIEYKAEEV